MSIDELKDFVSRSGLQSVILRDLCDVPQEIIDAADRGDKREFSCPKCGGKTRFRIYDLERGSVGCSHCCKNKDDGSGDIIGAVMWAKGLKGKDGRIEAKRKLEEWLIERGYMSATRQTKQGGYKLYKTTTTTTTKTTTKQAPKHSADETLTMDAQSVEYADDNVSRRPIKTTFYHRFNPKTNFISTFRRDDYDEPKPKNKETTWITLEKDAQGASVYAPYIAGAATTTEKPPKDTLKRLLDETYHATHFYIAEGEKCVEALKNAVRSTSYDGVVLTMGGSGNAKLWPIWAAHLKRKNPNAKVTIFADNDACGRKAANETANAFHAAGYTNIRIVDLSQDRDGDDGYDVADYIAEGRDVATLLDEANGYITTYDNLFYFSNVRSALIRAAKTRLQLEADRQRGLAESFLISGEGEVSGEEARKNDDFRPLLGTLPRPMRDTVNECALGLDMPMINVVAFDLAFLGSWISFERAEMEVKGRHADTLVSAIGGGDSGIGKSPAFRLLSAPQEEIEKAERARDGKAASRLDFLKEDLKDLTRERREISAKLRRADDDAKKTLEDELSRTESEILKLKSIVAAIDAPPQQYLLAYASPQGLVRVLNRNAKAARAQKRTPPGAIIFTPEGQRITNVKNGATSHADDFSILSSIADHEINNMTTKDDPDPNKEFSVGAGVCIATQTSACGWLRYNDTTKQGMMNRPNIVYIDYRYGVNPNYADLKRLWRRRILFNALYEWEGAHFQPSPEVVEAFEKWRNDNKNKADQARRVDKERNAYLLKREIQVLRNTLILHVARQFWELTKDWFLARYDVDLDSDDLTPAELTLILENTDQVFAEWRMLMRRERYSRDEDKDIRDYLDKVFADDEKFLDNLDGLLAPGSSQNWDEWVDVSDETGTRSIKNPRLVVPVEEFYNAVALTEKFDAARSKAIRIAKFESGQIDDNPKSVEGDFTKVFKTVEKSIHDHGKRIEIPNNLPESERDALTENEIVGLFAIERRDLQQKCTPFKKGTAETRKTLEALMVQNGRLIVENDTTLVLIDYANETTLDEDETETEYVSEAA